MTREIIRFVEDQQGATAIEYGLLAALVAIGAIVSFTVLGNGLMNLFGKTDEGVGEVITDAVSKV